MSCLKKTREFDKSIARTLCFIGFFTAARAAPVARPFFSHSLYVIISSSVEV